jgi:hypothetical protein
LVKVNTPWRGHEKGDSREKKLGRKINFWDKKGIVVDVGKKEDKER